MLRFAIVGAGIMGSNHARVLGMLAGARIAVVIDKDSARGETLARTHGALYSADLADAAGADAAIVATPTADHAEVAVALMELGCHVMVEKPLAATVEECARILRAAEQRRRTLMVGHVERFNPAVLELPNLLDDVLHIDIARIGPTAQRVTDSVVSDLMIHDLDLARCINPAQVVGVAALGRRGVRSDRTELACALLEFENGVTASLTASQLGQSKIRRIEITQRDSFVTVDLVRQDVSVGRVTHQEFLSHKGATYRQSGITEIPFLTHRGEPLFLELQEFVDALSGGRTPAASGEDGLLAVELAVRVQRALSQG